ncbi:MAG: cyclic pyranopterin monophosphate synthase MoaC, partial [Pirellulaceae bacterium]
MNDLTHFDSDGGSQMVDVGKKEVTDRSARAEATILMQAGTLTRIFERDLAKGDVLEVARLAGIMAAKKTSNLIPLCHSLELNSAHLLLEAKGETRLRIESTVAVTARTGVEMEA